MITSSYLDVLQYLHADHDRSHSDLHAANILVSQSIMKDGILLIDFGAGERGSRSTNDETSLPSDWEAGDLTSLGAMLKSVLPALFKGAGPYQIPEAEHYCETLQNGAVSTIPEAITALRAVIDPSYIVTENRWLFRTRDGSPLYIPIPVWDSVPVGEPLLRVINTPIFQRLRAIKQLSFCDWFYPGAVHSRFEHSIGTLGVVRRAVDGLLHDEHFRHQYSPDDIQGLYLAALTHDLNHRARTRGAL